MSTNSSTPVTKTILNEIKDTARAHWLEGRDGLDGAELVAYSYLRAIEVVLRIDFNFDLPIRVDRVSEED